MTLTVWWDATVPQIHDREYLHKRQKVVEKWMQGLQDQHSEIS